jgi:endogenous inhibitor of DNA gyrase (YacG/DUF329 family)
MSGHGEAEWPQYPFCSPRCKLIDLGRWLGEEYGYRVESETPEEVVPETDGLDGPP